MSTELSIEKIPPNRREGIDKSYKMGYHKGTKGLPVGQPPPRHREVTVTLEELGQLLLFVILENQSNDS